VTPLLVSLGFALLLLASVRLLASRKKTPTSPPRFRTEYWVYCNLENRPSDQDLLDATVHKNPYTKLGAAEGLTMSDVRFHIGFARREKNAMLFRPDIFAESDAEITHFVPDILARCTSIVMLRFISERDDARPTYLSFMIHAVDAIARMGNAPAIWDTETQRFTLTEEFHDMLRNDPSGTKFETHVTVHWSEAAEEGRAFTRGMAKRGLPDLEFDRQPLDQRTLAMFLVEESARQCWEAGTLGSCEMSDFGEVFEVDFSPPRAGTPTHRGWIASIHAVRKRLQSA
jgi:hypothetical protein